MGAARATPSSLMCCDNLIHSSKLPPMVAVTIEAGGQDAQGSRARLFAEYDTVSGT